MSLSMEAAIESLVPSATHAVLGNPTLILEQTQPPGTHLQQEQLLQAQHQFLDPQHQQPQQDSPHPTLQHVNVEAVVHHNVPQLQEEQPLESSLNAATGVNELSAYSSRPVVKQEVPDWAKYEEDEDEGQFDSKPESKSLIVDQCTNNFEIETDDYYGNQGGIDEVVQDQDDKSPSVDDDPDFVAPLTAQRPRRAGKKKRSRSRPTGAASSNKHAANNKKHSSITNDTKQIEIVNNIDNMSLELCNLPLIIAPEAIFNLSNERRMNRSHPLSMKIEAISYAEANSNSAASRKYNVDAKSIREWRKQKDAIIQLAQKDPIRKRMSGAGRKPSKKRFESTSNTRPRSSYGLGFKLDAVKYCEQHSAEAAATIFGVDSRRIREWKHQKDVLEQRRLVEGPSSINKKRKKSGDGAAVESTVKIPRRTTRSNPRSLTFLHQCFCLSTVSLHRYSSKEIHWNTVFPPNPTVTFPNAMSLTVPKKFDKTWKLYRLARYFPNLKEFISKDLENYKVLMYLNECWNFLEKVEVTVDVWKPEFDSVMTGWTHQRCVELLETIVPVGSEKGQIKSPGIVDLRYLKSLKIFVELKKAEAEGKDISEDGRTGLTDVSIHWCLDKLKKLSTLEIPVNDFSEHGRLTLVKVLDSIQNIVIGKLPEEEMQEESCNGTLSLTAPNELSNIPPTPEINVTPSNIETQNRVPLPQPSNTSINSTAATPQSAHAPQTPRANADSPGSTVAGTVQVGNVGPTVAPATATYFYSQGHHDWSSVVNLQHTDLRAATGNNPGLTAVGTSASIAMPQVPDWSIQHQYFSQVLQR